MSVQIGDVVEARPWKSGREIYPLRGIVVACDPFGDTTRMLVWFPALGAPLPGSSCQPILTSKMQPAGTVEDTTASWVAAAYRVLRAHRREYSDSTDEISRWAFDVKVRMEQVWRGFNAARRAAA